MLGLVSPVPEDGLSRRFSTWLLRPYLDLGPFRDGPLHVRALEECWGAFVDPTKPRVLVQRALPPAFRMQLSAEAGRNYALSDPRHLPKELWTDRWYKLCAAVDAWSKLSSEQQCRLAALLHSMCLYELMLNLIPGVGFDARRAGAHALELAFWRDSAKFMRGLNIPTYNHADADLSVFEDIALNGQACAQTQFNATAVIFVHKAKNRAAVGDLAAWGKRFENALILAVAGMDSFTAELYTSRFHRGMGFLPQRRGDKDGVVRTMDLAEDHAHMMRPTTSVEELLFRENLHALMESRTKEALWLDDIDQALLRSQKVVEVDPYDSKAWVELGQVHHRRQEWPDAAQAYCVASMLGPPASAVGRHMAGVCFRELGQDLLASLFFRDTLEHDPLGISPREEIHRLPDIPVLQALKEWSRSTDAPLSEEPLRGLPTGL